MATLADRRGASLRLLGPMLLLLLAGNCVPVFVFSGSDLHFSWEPLIQRPTYHEFSLRFRSELQSSRNMDMAIADAFGYPLNNDPQIQQVAQDFLEPGLDVLANYGIPISIGLPKANVPARRIEFSTGWSKEFTPLIKDTGQPLCTAAMNTSRKCTFQVQLTDAYGEFNPALPKQIKIYATRHVVVRLYTDEGRAVAPGLWQTARLEVFLQHALSEALEQRYTRYFKDKYGLDVKVRSDK